MNAWNNSKIEWNGTEQSRTSKTPDGMVYLTSPGPFTPLPRSSEFLSTFDIGKMKELSSSAGSVGRYACMQPES